MATLYVENFPDELYEALRKQAKSNRRSIAAETVALVEQCVPTAAEIARREAFYQQVVEIASQNTATASGPSTEELLREDRER